MMSLDVGDKAPDFSLPTDGGGTLSLQDLKGKTVVLYFYPKDMTPGCTTEAQDFRDRINDFDKAGAVIVGASKDSVKRHDNFKAKHELNFPLLSDEDGTLCEAYGVWQLKKLYGREYMGIMRATFVIDGKGIIQHVWPKVRVKEHAQAVLEVVREL
jgi:thioredoxin-dependent peroxiredoxin